MDSWSYGSEEKGLSFTDEMDLPVNAFAYTRKALLSWDIKPSTDFEAVESMDSMDFGFSYMNKIPFYGNTSLGIFGAEIANDSAKRLVSPTCMFTSSSYYGENESGSKHCSSLMESNSQESSLIDLKLGRLSDYSDAQDGKLLKEASVVSSVFPALTVKKSRTTSSPCCQVYGCNKDLSFSKGYHKRHKVCEAHSKTPKVIVNGIEQRFCQQCSRFHLLAEFDDVKRSCRKRLAGHNERRRKLHFDTLPGKPSKLLQIYQGAKFVGSSMVKRAPSLDETEEKPIYAPWSAIPITNWQLIPKSSFHMHGIGTFSSASEAFNDPNIASSRVEESYGVPHSDCALSLLSPLSQYSSNHAHHSSGKSVAIGSLEKSNGFYTYGVDQEGSSGAGHTFNFEAQT